MTAVERFKWLLANALERVCVLEAELEKVRAENEALKAGGAEKTGD